MDLRLVTSAVTVLRTLPSVVMIHDDSNPSGAAPARAPLNEVSEGAPPQTLDPLASTPGNFAEAPRPIPPPTPPRLDPLVPEDLRTPWELLDVLLFIGFGILGLVVALTAVVGVLVLGFGVPFGELALGATSTIGATVSVITQAVWSGFVLLYFYTLVRVRTQAPFWRTMGWRGLPFASQTPSGSIIRCLGGGAMLALFVSFAGRFFNEKGELPIEELFHSRQTVVLLMGFGILVAPLVEETMFRGFLYPILARRFGVVAGVIVTGVLFGAMHAQQLWGGWGQIGLLIGVGIFLTWVRARTGTVATSYFVHLGYNSLLFLGFFIGTGGLRHIPGGS
jgi:membrane protease YdiL (CAAX protease family)